MTTATPSTNSTQTPSNTTRPTAIRTDLQPYSDEQTATITADFHRDGYRVIKNMLEPAEVAALKNAVDRFFVDPRMTTTVNHYGDWIGVRLFEFDPLFEDLLTREPIITLAEHFLGHDCHIMANNVVRNFSGTALDTFHVDDVLICPLPDEIPRFDPRMTMPLHVVTVQIPLTDMDTIEKGPTQFVPGSHYSGRQPNDTKAPTFEGRGPDTILCKAGDVYLHNGQCWHRGAPNTSDQPRYLLQLSYSRRWVSQRFFPFVNYEIPPRVLARADDRRKRVLGFHAKGPYG